MGINYIDITICSGRHPPSSKPWKTFASRADKFIQKTQEYVLQGLDPGGVYRAIWARDASYILKDWFLSGNIEGVLRQIHFMWSHQIEAKKEQKLVYGRGSPEMNFSSEVANEEKLKEFEGALPTTIYHDGFSEVYGQNPDIDSTALMLSTTSWILTRTLKEEEEPRLRDLSARPIIAAEHSSDYVSALLSKVGITDPSKVTDFVIPKMLKAIYYLISRDKDNDGLLEQDHNEDWMDTILRSGKIVYSQACWLLALTDFTALLIKVGREGDAKKLMTLTMETIQAVEEKLWSDNDGSYVDIQKYHDFEEPYRMLTQDISLYLVAITQNMITQWQNKKEGEIQELKGIQRDHYVRAISTFNTMRSRLWNENWPLITEVELKASGPWTLKPYEYHNQTFWPWISGIEMLARGRFNRIEECNILLSKIATKRPHIPAFYEWINPITDQPNGAFPFRTGISAIRLALFDIIHTNKLYPQ
ncbi:MAG: GH116 family glycosyl hydrolase [Candidatus Nitrosopolaris sp.]